METLSEIEIQRIKESIASFSKRASSVSSQLDADFSRKLSSAKSAASSFSRQCENAKKIAHTAIDKVYSGNGINDTLKQKGESYASESNATLNAFCDEINSVIRGLPRIGVVGDSTSSR